MAFSYESGGLECRPGCRVEAPFGRSTRSGWVVSLEENPPEGIENIKALNKLLDEDPIFNEELLELGRWMANYYFCSLGEALACMSPSAKKERGPKGSFSSIPELSAGHVLADQQKSALKGIFSGQNRLNYLYGITGSGKTEVYLHAAERVLARNRGVIFLVPEIALSHQLLKQIRERFGERCAVLHSRLSAGEKLREWKRLLRGEADIAVGARSAVFAPVKNPGLIIIDEEHESSYKSGSTPRYHARQIAMRRVEKNQALLIMGSATPSIEAWYHIRKKDIQLLCMKKRLAGGSIPKVEIVDMKQESGPFSEKLLQEIKKVKQKGKQSILFLNRRGFSHFLICKSCEEPVMCKFCSVPMTYHKKRGILLCHYCGYQLSQESPCPSCHSLELRNYGFGTEKLEEEISRHFPDYKIARLDRDTTGRKGSLEKVLDDFRAGKLDILLGTQMIAKGLNFPKVELVGIIQADMGLNVPDFRASERVFNLIIQVAGRAGRFSNEGKVIVQSYQPKNEAIQLGAAFNIQDFIEKELEIRQMLAFPPYKRLFRFVFRSKNAAKASNAAARFASLLPVSKELFILGPCECPLSVVAGNYRWHILIKTRSLNTARPLIAKALDQFNGENSVYLEIDPDPVSLL